MFFIFLWVSFSSHKGNLSSRKQSILFIGVREGILLGGRKKFALKLTICPNNRQLALKQLFS